MNSHKLDGSQQCPNCLSVLDGATNVHGQGGPEPGDYTICAYCQVPLKFNASLGLERLTAAEILDLPAEVARALVAAQQAAGQAVRERLLS